MTHIQISGRLLARNSLFNFIGQGIPLLVGVVTIPLIVGGLGEERFGLLSIAWIVLESFTIFDLGLGRAATKYIAEALGKGEEEQMPRLIWATVTVQVALGMVGMLILVGITPLLIERTLNIPPALRAEAKTSFYLLALSIPAVFVSSSLAGVLAAAQRFDLVNAVGISLSIVGSLLKLVGVLFWEWHLPEIIAMLIVSRLLALVTYYWLCMCVFPFFKGLPRFYRTELRALIRFGGWLTVSNIIGPLLVYLDRFMLGMLLTMAAVAYYSVPYDMVTRVLIIPTSLVAALFPAFSALISQGEWERLGYFLSRSVKWVLLTVGPVVVIVVVIGRDILQLWLGPIFAEESTPILQILAIGVLVNSLAHLPFALLQAASRPDLTAKFHLAELPVHGLLVWWLISLWGTTGAALAWSIRVALDALLLFIAVRRLGPLPSYSFVFDTVTQISLFLLLLACVVIGISSLPLGTWLRFLGLGIAFFPVGILGWRYMLDGKDRDQIAKLLSLESVK